MAKFRVHYKMVCEGYLDFDVDSEDEARQALMNDPHSLFRESLDDEVEVVDVEELEEDE